MTNWCQLSFEIYTKSREDQVKLLGYINSFEDKETSDTCRYLPISVDRCVGLHQPAEALGECTVLIYGECKHSLESDEFVALIKKLKAVSDFDNVSCIYAEYGTELFGKFLYDKGLVTDLVLLDEFIPTWDEEKEDYEEDIYEAIESYGVENFVYNFN